MQSLAAFSRNTHVQPPGLPGHSPVDERKEKQHTAKMAVLLTGKMPVLLTSKMAVLLTGKMPVLLTGKMPVLRRCAFSGEA